MVLRQGPPILAFSKDVIKRSYTLYNILAFSGRQMAHFGV